MDWKYFFSPLQFARLKLGDRFFYDLGLDPNTRFSEQQLREIRKTSMARILCDNTDTVTRYATDKNENTFKKTGTKSFKSFPKN